MKTWLDEVLITLSNRNNLNPKFNSLVKLASNLKQSGAVKYWTAGVIFEFCDLDKSKDQYLTLFNILLFNLFDTFKKKN